jgi:GH24 family phage-related lysozyme (muramidase)
MTYLNTHARTTSPTNNDKFQPAGRTTALSGVFIGFVKEATDVQKNGRLRVWIAELGSAPENPDGWIIVNYCSPFAGATNVETISKADVESFEGTQTSYGFWMVPPDINNQVLVMFINGDASRGIWIGSLYNQYMNNMVPGMAADSKSWQYPGKQVPVAEYNKWDPKVTQPDRAFHPYEKTKFKGVGNQGLITDKGRGVTTSSARRESPSSVFGILTPGPVVKDVDDARKIRRKGGSSFIMDDGEGTEYVQLATKSGAQIRIDETNGFVYLINRDGTSWVQMDKDGNVDIFGAKDISLRAQRDLNIRADRNVNIEAGQNIFMKAAKDTKQQTTSFTYDINNVPQPKTIPEWSYVGEGKGQGGNIVMQALNNWQSTIQKGAYLTVVENDMNIKIGNTLNLTTVNGGQNYNSKLGIKMTTEAAFDLAATGNIRIGSKGTISVVGATGIIVCTDADLNLKAAGNIVEAAAGALSISAMGVGINSLVNIGGLLNVTSSITGDFPGLRSGPGVNTAGPGPLPLNPAAAEAALGANTARPAEVKPMNEKINILATWKDAESKFKRNSQGLQTTTSRLPTYEPCPEHAQFTFASIAGYTPVITPDDKTYDGSSGKGNDATVTPAPAVNPGANNTSVSGDSVVDSSVSKDLNVAALRCQLIIHEGIVNKSYNDTGGLLTGGIGHLFRANEITQYPLGSPIPSDQVETWFSQDSTSAIKIGQTLLGDTWGDLSDVRKRAIADLSFNLGKARLAKFVNFLSAMKKEDYTAAGTALKNSAWYGQVGKRGPNIVTMITQNVDPNGCDKKFPG